MDEHLVGTRNRVGAAARPNGGQAQWALAQYGRNPLLMNPKVVVMVAVLVITHRHTTRLNPDLGEGVSRRFRVLSPIEIS